MHRLSVIIPTYNRASTIATAVESVLEQSLPPGQVVVVDDGSTDDTARVLQRYRRHIRLLRIPHSGASTARNHGVAHSDGEWLAFLDSDDTWHQEKLRCQFEALATTGHSLCFCHATSQQGHPLDDLHPPDHNPDAVVESRPAADERYLSQRRHPFIQSMLVRRNLLLKAGAFPAWLAVAEDTRLIHRLVWQSPSTIIHRPLCIINRPANHIGLSSQPKLPAARIHYENYAMVQSELLPLAISAGPAACRTVSSQLSYFLSRLAEIELADGHVTAAKRFAAASLSGPPSLRRWLRGLLILTFPTLASHTFSHKWTPSSRPALPQSPAGCSSLATQDALVQCCGTPCDAIIRSSH